MRYNELLRPYVATCRDPGPSPSSKARSFNDNGSATTCFSKMGFNLNAPDGGLEQRLAAQSTCQQQHLVSTRELIIQNSIRFQRVAFIVCKRTIRRTPDPETNRKNSREGPPHRSAFIGKRDVPSPATCGTVGLEGRRSQTVVSSDTQFDAADLPRDSCRVQCFWKASTRVWYGAYVASLNACWRFSETGRVGAVPIKFLGTGGCGGSAGGPAGTRPRVPRGRPTSTSQHY